MLLRLLISCILSLINIWESADEIPRKIILLGSIVWIVMVVEQIGRPCFEKYFPRTDINFETELAKDDCEQKSTLLIVT